MGVQVFTANGTFDWSTTGLQTTITIECIGGGGGGGGVSGYPSGGGGGKGGGYAKKTITKGAETTLAVTVGAAGTAGPSTGGAGGAGGYSKVVQGSTDVVLAPGGNGGSGGTSNNGSYAGATGANGTAIGDVTRTGGNGAAGNYSSAYSGAGGGAAGPSANGGNASTYTAGAHGGGNFIDGNDYCSLGAAGRQTSENDGITGPGVGAGGGGGYAADNTNHAGGAGYRGVVVITWTTLNAYSLPVASGSFSTTGTSVGLKYGRKLSIASGSYSLTGTAVTLTKATPPASTNDFSADPHCKAVWRLEDGALTTDSKGTNTLTNSGVTSDTTNYKEGSGSGSFVYSTGDKLTITDSNLNTGFPFKYGGSANQMTMCFWFRPDADHDEAGYIISKYDTVNNKRSFGVTFDCSGTYQNVVLWLGTGTGSAGTAYNQLGTCQYGQWYHVGITYDNSDYSYRIRVWDATGNAILGTDLTGNHSGAIPVTDATTYIGQRDSSGLRTFGGNIDEVVVFNRVLSTTEIDAVRAGTFKSKGLSIASGSYSLTGTAVSIKSQRKLSIQSNAYAVTGTHINLKRGLTLPIGSGTFTMTGTNLSLKYNRKVSAQSGVYSWSGTNLTLTKSGIVNYSLALQSGTFVSTGTNLSLKYDRKIPISSGSYTYTGTNVGLRYGRVIRPASGSYTLTGTHVGLTKSSSIVWEEDFDEYDQDYALDQWDMPTDDYPVPNPKDYGGDGSLMMDGNPGTPGMIGTDYARIPGTGRRGFMTPIFSNATDDGLENHSMGMQCELPSTPQKFYLRWYQKDTWVDYYGFAKLFRIYDSTGSQRVIPEWRANGHETGRPVQMNISTNESGVYTDHHFTGYSLDDENDYTAGEWKCYEIMIDSIDKKCAFWVDGVSMGEQDIVGWSSTYSFRYLFVGSQASYTTGQTGHSIWYDDIVLATSYIGESEESSVNSYTIRPASGVYTWTGTGVGIQYGRKFPIASGAYSLTGTSLSLKTARQIALATGSYSSTGTSVNLLYGRKIGVDSGEFTLVGTHLNLTKAGINVSFPISSGTYTFTGTPVGLKRGYVIKVKSGKYGGYPDTVMTVDGTILKRVTDTLYMEI